MAGPSVTSAALADVLAWLPVGICVVGAGGRTLFANPSFDALVADAPTSIARLVAEALERRSPVTREPAPGRAVRLCAAPIGDAGDMAVVTATDVTDEVLAREASLEARTRLQAAIHHAPIVIWTIDETGVVELSEGAGLARLGLRSGELVGQSLFDLYRGHPTIPHDIRRALAGEAFTYATQVGEVKFETWIAPIYRNDATISGAIAVSTDVTERDALQARIIRNDRVNVLGTLAASVGHEVNNPLAYASLAMEHVARGFSRLRRVLDEPDPDVAALRARLDELEAPVATVTDGLRRISAITADLRTFARDDQGHGPVDVRASVASVLQLVSAEVTTRARLVTRLEEVPVVRGNEARLGQVFLNLLINAMQALPTDRDGRDDEVCVSTREDGGDVLVTVSDTGSGVPAEIRERLFEPLVTGRPEGNGTGLGLFVCSNIVRGLGGSISFAARPSGGTEFTVRLPAWRRAEDDPG